MPSPAEPARRNPFQASRREEERGGLVAPSHPQPAGAGGDRAEAPREGGKRRGAAAFAFNKEERERKSRAGKIKQGKLFKSSWEVRAELKSSESGGGRGGEEKGKEIKINRKGKEERERGEGERGRDTLSLENIQIDFPVIKYPVRMIHFLVLVCVGMREGEAKIEIKRKSSL